MDSRSDQQKYEAGAKTMENFIPLIYGAAERRPGTEFIAEQKDSSAKGRLIAFEHSVDDTYILLFENQVLRFFKDGAQIFAPVGTEDLSAFDSVSGDSSLISHWKLNDNLATTNVIDGTVAGNHDGTATSNTSTFSAADEGGVANKALDLGGAEYITIGNDNDFSFGDGTDDSPFSVAIWVNYDGGANNRQIISKYDPATDREWKIESISGAVRVTLFDESTDDVATITVIGAMSTGWHFVVFTYDGRGGDAAADGVKIYIDRSESPVDRSTEASYAAMENLTADVLIGENNAGASGERWESGVNNVAIFNKQLSSEEIAALVGTGAMDNVYEIVTPYLTADLPALKFEQSADVMFITHPSYEPRRLSRLGDASWTIEEADLRTGPFRDQNGDTAKTITASATTGSVTLTAVGHSPFVDGTTAGHLPSGSGNTSKSLTGALFKLVQAVSGTDASISEEIEANTLNDASATLFVPKGVTWDFTTNGTWGAAADPATIVLERSYDSETTYETVVTVTSAANKNVTTSGTEEVADALYRARTAIACAADTDASIQFSIRDTSHVGTVEITAVASPQSATATVLETLASTDPTHRFSEGSFSNLRSWPIDVAISSEERLTFAGNVSEPLTTWGSVIGDFTDFALGTNDDDGIQFTLIGTGQQNRIRWMLAKETLVLGTVGGEHLLGASKDEEALSPTNVKAKIQTTYGSEDIAAILINQATLFVQRGGKKIREFLYNFEADSHRADDLTVFSNRITGDGILDMAFQRTPDPTLWCIRTDGQIAILTYERDQNVFSWYRLVTNTNLAGTATASVIESVAVIFGGARSEDEVWVTVLRQIGGADARYVERFRPRLLPTSTVWAQGTVYVLGDEKVAPANLTYLCIIAHTSTTGGTPAADFATDLAAAKWKLSNGQADYRFLDSSITDTGGDTTIEGLTHLIGQTVQVLGDGLVQATKVVNGSGVITAATTAAKYQVGLGYDSTLVPMDVDIEGTGLTTTKRINRAFVNLFETIGGTVGPDSSRQESTGTGTTLFTGPKIIAIPGGYTRDTDITIKQTDPLPMSVLSIGYDLGASAD